MLQYSWVRAPAIINRKRPRCSLLFPGIGVYLFFKDRGLHFSQSAILMITSPCRTTARRCRENARHAGTKRHRIMATERLFESNSKLGVKPLDAPHSQRRARRGPGASASAKAPAKRPRPQPHRRGAGRPKARVVGWPCPESPSTVATALLPSRAGAMRVGVPSHAHKLAEKVGRQRRLHACGGEHDPATFRSATGLHAPLPST